MTDLGAAIRARLDDWLDKLGESYGDPLGYDALQSAANALLAIVDAHPLAEFTWTDGSVKRVCNGCDRQPLYPCTELRVIAEKLGVQA